nr:hypothetical protein [Celeribacter baekdonensis]
MCTAFEPKEQFQKTVESRGLARLVRTKDHGHIGGAIGGLWKGEICVLETAVTDQI